MRLIIAYDEEVYREGVTSLLADFEWIEVVGEADNGAALLELLESVAPEAVLLDPGISDEPGLQLVEKVRAVAPEVRVLVIAVDDHIHMREAIELGVAAYLLKSSSAHELATALRMVADGHHYIQAELVTTYIQAEPVDSPGDPSAAPPRPLRDRLSAEQLTILRFVIQGLRNKQVARELGISETTLKSHLRVIYSQLDASSRVEAVAAALRLGVVE